MAVTFVLADADSFYASCERVFHPELSRLPLVVLSNNDGCVVSRSHEAKLLGISNGTPWFKIRGQAQHDGVIARSSNYELYASLSRRMMRLMTATLPGHEIYSIDECFLSGFQDPQRTRIACTRMRETMLQGTGIPLTIAIAPTRTLAKIVSHYTKHQDPPPVLRAPATHGIGAARHTLHRAGRLQRHRRIPETAAHVQQNVRPAHNRPARPLRHSQHLRAAGSHPATQARITDRHGVTVFIATSPFDQDYQSRSGSIILTDPADDPLTIARAVVGTLLRMIDPHARYVRAGVMLGTLTSTATYQTFEGVDATRDNGLGQALDNRKFGAMRVGIGWAGIRGHGRSKQETGAEWNMKRHHLSIRGTTRWDELCIVKV